MRVKWIENKGKKILFEDFSKLNGDEMLDVLSQATEVLKQLRSPVPILGDYTDSFPSTKFMEELKKQTKKYDHLIEKTASIGITGMKKILAKGVSAITGQRFETQYFNTLEECKDFLSQ